MSSVYTSKKDDEVILRKMYGFSAGDYKKAKEYVQVNATKKFRRYEREIKKVEESFIGYYGPCVKKQEKVILSRISKDSFSTSKYGRGYHIEYENIGLINKQHYIRKTKVVSEESQSNIVGYIISLQLSELKAIYVKDILQNLCNQAYYRFKINPKNQDKTFSFNKINKTAQFILINQPNLEEMLQTAITLCTSEVEYYKYLRG